MLRLHQLLGWRSDRRIGMGFGITRKPPAVRGPWRLRLRVHAHSILPLPVGRDVDAEMSGNLLWGGRAAQAGFQRRRNCLDPSSLHPYGPGGRITASKIVQNRAPDPEHGIGTESQPTGG